MIREEIAKEIYLQFMADEELDGIMMEHDFNDLYLRLADWHIEKVRQHQQHLFDCIKISGVLKEGVTLDRLELEDEGGIGYTHKWEGFKDD